MAEKPVYSTKAGTAVAAKSGKGGPAGAAWPVKAGPAKVRLEKKGRGGKTVTVLFELPLNEAEADAARRAMQAAFGCGGTLGEGTIELAGDVRDRVEQFFAKKSWKLIRAGG